MKRRFQKLYAASFVLIPLFVLVQTAFKIVPELRLHGVTTEARLPAFSLPAWFTGEFQPAFTKWFDENVGMRAVWVRTDNQINFSVFRELRGSEGAKLIVGKDNWLYEPIYVYAYGRSVGIKTEVIQEIADNLRVLQDELDRRRIPLLVLISPSKAEIYPEFIPPHYLPEPEERRGPSNYERTVLAFERRGIRFLDGHQRFLDLKKTKPYPVFAKTGLHWNLYGVYPMVEEIVTILNPLMHKPMPVPTCSSVELREPTGTDKDLSDLMNIWTRVDREASAPYPVIEIPDTKKEDRTNLLIVGDSFAFEPGDILSRNHASKISVLYYYQRLFTLPRKKRGHPFDRENTDLEKFLEDKDAVILEINEIFLPYVGFGFVEDMLKALQIEPPATLTSSQL